MNELLLYFILILDNIHYSLEGFIVLLIVFFIVSVGFSLFCASHYLAGERGTCAVALKISTIVSIFFFLAMNILSVFATFLPTTQQAAVIYVVPKLLRTDTTETLSRLPNKIALKLENYVDEWANESLTKDTDNENNNESKK